MSCASQGAPYFDTESRRLFSEGEWEDEKMNEKSERKWKIEVVILYSTCT